MLNHEIECSKREMAKRIAKKIEESLKQENLGKVPRVSITVSYGLHLALESIAQAIEVDKTWFKKECGVGQPVAYFI